jgi:hypothetical protein
MLVYNWTSNVFVLGVGAKVSLNAEVSVIGITIGASLGVSIVAEGGYNSGWYFDAKTSAQITVYTGQGNLFPCGTKLPKVCTQSVPCGLSCCCGKWWKPRLPKCTVNWCELPYPCGFSVKVCISGSMNVSYSQRNGFKMKF